MSEMKVELLPNLLLGKDGKWFIHSYQAVLVPDMSKYTSEDWEVLEE